MKCTANGCNAMAMKDQSFCYWHNPAVPEEEKQANRAKGGRSSKPIQPWNIPSELEPINDLHDLKKLYNSALFWLTAGLITPSQAHALKTLASGLCDVLELQLVRELALGRIELEEILQKGESSLIEVEEWPLLISRQEN